MGLRRTRILVLVKGLGIGGAERLIAAGAGLWDKSRFEYTVAYVLPWKDQFVQHILDEGHPVECIGGRGGHLGAGAALRLRSLIRRAGIDIVHAHLPMTGVLARLVSPVPVVYTEHNLAGSYRWPTRILNRATYPLNAAVTAVSDAVASSVAAYGGPAPLTVVNGVSAQVVPTEAERIRAELGILPSEQLVVHVGNIRPHKGHRTLIAAVASLPEHVKVVSIGSEKHEGDLARLLQEVESQGLGGRLRFLGRKENALSYIAAADVYVNPADAEGLPITVLEALALAKPVVATDVGGVGSVVQHHVSGLLVDPGDPIALAEAVLEVLGSADRGAALGRAGRALVEESYGLERMIRSFEDLYVDVSGHVTR